MLVLCKTNISIELLVRVAFPIQNTCICLSVIFEVLQCQSRWYWIRSQIGKIRHELPYRVLPALMADERLVETWTFNFGMYLKTPYSNKTFIIQSKINISAVVVSAIAQKISRSNFSIIAILFEFNHFYVHWTIFSSWAFQYGWVYFIYYIRSFDNLPSEAFLRKSSVFCFST